MFESIIGFQLFIFITLVFSRIKSSDFMTAVAIGWTVFTFLMVFATFLLLLQLVTIWGTAWLLEQLFSTSNTTETNNKSFNNQNKPAYEADNFTDNVSVKKEDGKNEKLRNSIIENTKKVRARRAAADAELKRLLDSDPSFKTAWESNEEEFKELEESLLKAYDLHDAEAQLFEKYGISEHDLADTLILDSSTNSHKKLNLHTTAASANSIISKSKELSSETVETTFQTKVAVTSLDENTTRDFLSVTNTNKIKIKDFVQTLNIPYLVHFTRADNLQNILENGLMSVSHSQYKGLSAVKNDRHRYDGQLDGTSLSISFPNYLMFYKYRKHEPDTDWAVLLLSPSIMWEKDCAFYRFNAADKRMSIIPRNYAKTVKSLEEMFSADVEERDNNLKPYDPTDPQAEVMIYDVIEPNYIQAIVFDNEKTQDKVKMQFPTINNFITKVDGNLFSPRLYARKNYKGI